MNKKILYITGCCGFMGSYFTRLCLQQGWYVRGIDKMTYASNPEFLKEFSSYSTFSFDKIDINDLTRLVDCDYFVNFCAESHVDNSIVNSQDFIKTNINGVYNILQLLRSYKINGYKIPIFYHISCYDEKTKALTKDGLKSYNEIKIGDEVVSINPITSKIEFKKVLNVIVQDYDGEMIHFKNKSDDLLVTPNHKMFFNKLGKIKIDEARNICDDYGTFYLRGVKEGKKCNFLNLKDIGNVPIKDLFYVSGIFIGDGFNSKLIKKIKNKSGFDRKGFLKKCRNDITGRFISTKNTEKNFKEYSICNSYRIFFDIPKNDKARKKLEKSLTNLKIKWYSEEGKSGEHIYFSSKQWMEYFEQFGKYAINKTIPNWMFEYDNSILRFLYNGIIDSDGYWKINKTISEKTGNLTTISYNLVQKCCILGACLGFHVRFFYYEPKSSVLNGRIIKGNHKVYRVYFNQQNISFGNKKYSKEQYNGKIWCLTVEDNKNFLVERNGFLKISGNTDETYGDIKVGSHTETDLLKPSNPYSATKACGDMLITAWGRTFGLPYNLIRPTNNYGIGQYVEKLIPKTCKYLTIGRKIDLHNHGEPKRVWLHAEDTANAILTIIKSNAINEIFNVSGNYEDNNINVVRKIISIYFESEIKDINKYIDFNCSRNGQDVRYSLDDSKLRKLGWEPIKKFDKEIPSIVEYYKNNFIW